MRPKKNSKRRRPPQSCIPRHNHPHRRVLNACVYAFSLSHLNHGHRRRHLDCSAPLLFRSKCKTEIEFRECVNFPPRAASSLSLAACPLFGGCVVLASSLQKIDNILLLCFGYGRWSFVPGTSFEGGVGQMNSGFFTSFCWGVFPSFRFP